MFFVTCFFNSMMIVLMAMIALINMNRAIH